MVAEDELVVVELLEYEDDEVSTVLLEPSSLIRTAGAPAVVDSEAWVSGESALGEATVRSAILTLGSGVSHPFVPQLAMFSFQVTSNSLRIQALESSS